MVQYLYLPIFAIIIIQFITFYSFQVRSKSYVDFDFSPTLETNYFLVTFIFINLSHAIQQDNRGSAHLLFDSQRLLHRVDHTAIITESKPMAEQSHLNRSLSFNISDYFLRFRIVLF
ncbi:hypothetical protein BpHYR1_035564 [Brachionus plicatilis]|uniref:Uncharacterized protein n=1 Tax=Brachionus plicatilis TaxID=10195 RepID=A0A3M7P263_BRAPC|nr:hypothetical protein BpHYR1_035564 [Brachionus plicatilis]